MMKFIDNIICCLIANFLDFEKTSQEALLPSLNKTNKKFSLKLYQDSNTVTSKTQIHSSLYNATYFKYRAAIIRKYWFKCSRSYVKEIKITNLGLIEVSQKNLWVNAWNSALTLFTKSNHDINFIIIHVKTLVFVSYITNYTTKSNHRQYQYRMSTTFVWEAHNKAMQQ